MQIEITIDQLLKFLSIFGKSQYGIQYRALSECIRVLEDSLLHNVFGKSHGETKKIENKQELASLISSGVMRGDHKPAEARKGDIYYSPYLRKKELYGEDFPHKFLDNGFWDGIDVNMIGPDLQMKVESIIKRGFDYLAHHEKNRSVLKLSFLEAWQDIIRTIIEKYAEEIKSL